MNDYLFHVTMSQDGSESQANEQVLSLLSPDDVRAIGGLRDEAIAGVIERDPKAKGKILPQQFHPNPPFVQFMHTVIKIFGPHDPALQTAAAQQQESWIYIIDIRTPDGTPGRVPPEDIVGAFEVKTGHIIKESYSANQKHIIFSDNGLVQLLPFLQETLIRELKRLPV